MANSTGPDLLEVVRKVAREYEVFGELGRKGDADVWFLARKREDERLVALRLLARGTDQWGDPKYEVELAKELGAAVAAGQTACDACGASLRTFARFCGHCGADQARGANGGTLSVADRKLLLAEVREAASELYDVLGEMPWAGGEGVVYFALNRANRELVRLRLREADTGMELGETRVGGASVGAVTVTTMNPVPARPSASSVPLPTPHGVTVPNLPEPAPPGPLPPSAEPPQAAVRPPVPIEGRKVQLLTYAVVALSVIVLVELALFLFR